MSSFVEAWALVAWILVLAVLVFDESLGRGSHVSGVLIVTVGALHMGWWFASRKENDA